MYEYKAQRASLFTESGVETLTKIRDTAKVLLKTAGAFRAQEAWNNASGDGWTMMAALDYLVERGEIRMVTDPKKVAGQHQIYTA